MSSRFFQASDSSESDSDEQELYSGSEEESGDGAAAEEESSDEFPSDSSDDSSQDEDGPAGANRFLKAGADSDSDSEDSDDQAKVVKSAKDKRFEEAEAVVKLIDNALKINDWAVITAEFDKLTRLVPTLQKVLDGKNPKLYSRIPPRMLKIYFATHILTNY
jgi:translation initiation factor 3 subunit C